MRSYLNSTDDLSLSSVRLCELLPDTAKGPTYSSSTETGDLLGHCPGRAAVYWIHHSRFVDHNQMSRSQRAVICAITVLLLIQASPLLSDSHLPV